MNKLELTDSEIKYLKNLVQWNPSEEAQSIMDKINSSHKTNSLEGKGGQIHSSGIVPIYSIGQKYPTICISGSLAIDQDKKSSNGFIISG